MNNFTPSAPTTMFEFRLIFREGFPTPRESMGATDFVGLPKDNDHVQKKMTT